MSVPRTGRLLSLTQNCWNKQTLPITGGTQAFRLHVSLMSYYLQQKTNKIEIHPHPK